MQARITQLFTFNQLSLYINLVCFDSISAKDNYLSNQALLDGLFSARASGERAQKKRTSEWNVSGKALKHGNNWLLTLVWMYVALYSSLLQRAKPEL